MRAHRTGVFSIMPGQRAIQIAVIAALGCSLVSTGRAHETGQSGGGARFRASADLVVLHINVHDGAKPVPNLPQSAFAVSEDGRPQQITLFSGEDAPVTVGLVMDGSVSIWNIRNLVIAGAMSFSQAGNPQDERFGIAFNEAVLPMLPPDAPFTSDIPTLREAVDETLIGKGRTALFDAMSAGLAYAARGSHARKVLVIISDGGDNASHVTFEEIVAKAQASNVVIYTVAVVDPVPGDAKPRVLRRLAETTGGESFTPATPAEVERAFLAIAREIRESYTIGYMAERPPDNTFRKVRVAVTSANGRKLTVRTRAGYLASTSGGAQ